MVNRRQFLLAAGLAALPGAGHAQGRYAITPYVLAGSFPNVGACTRYRYHHSIVVSDTHVVGHVHGGVASSRSSAWQFARRRKGETHKYYSHVIYSDDHVKTWRIGGVAGENTDECAVVELTDGSLLMNMRSGGR